MHNPARDQDRLCPQIKSHTLILSHNGLKWFQVPLHKLPYTILLRFLGTQTIGICIPKLYVINFASNLAPSYVMTIGNIGNKIGNKRGLDRLSENCHSLPRSHAGAWERGKGSYGGRIKMTKKRFF